MNLNSSGSIGGTGTFTYTVATGGFYLLGCRSTFIAPSGTIVTVAQSGSATVSVASPIPSSLVTHAEASSTFLCAPGDVLTLTVASSSVADTIGNSRLESVFSLFQIF